jgi:sugar phosphate isomerase/epimerase
MIFGTHTHYAVNKLGLIEGVKLLMDTGYPALDFSFFGEQDFVHGDDGLENARKLRKMADERGVIFHQAHAPFGGYLEEFMQKQAPKFPRAFEFAGTLGVKSIVVHPIRPTPRYFGYEKENFDANVEYYASLAPLARENGLKIAIENMYGRNPFTNTIEIAIGGDAKELAAIYDALDDPDTFTICLDIGHAALCGFEPADAIRTLGHDRLGALHVHDVDFVSDLHTLPGMSKLNWDSICRALGEIDYKGVLTLEADYFLRNVDLELYPSAMKFMADTAKHLAAKVDSYRIK